MEEKVILVECMVFMLKTKCQMIKGEISGNGE